MTYFQDKLFFSASILFAGMFAWVGAILTVGDVRWLYATLASSTLTSGFLALTLRRPGDPMGIIVPRAALGVLGGVFGTKVCVVSFDSFKHLASTFEDDILFLCGISALVSMVSHIVGYAVIKAADDSAQNIASLLVKTLLKKFGLPHPTNTTPPKKEDV